MAEEKIARIDDAWINSISEDSPTGYILEVDISTPKKHHKKLSDYPLAPIKKTVNGAQLSKYQRDILKQLGKDEKKIEELKSAEKLILDFAPKKKYAVHYRNLQLYIDLGMKVTKIHRVLSFQQKPWLAPYIEANTEMRKKASNEFEKNFFKLMNNAFFGKTMEDVRKRRVIDIVNRDPIALNKLTAKPTYKSTMYISDDICAVERTKATVRLNKPIYLGLCVLDLSKFLMYDFYHRKLKQVFPESKLLFTDTDSLCISISGCDDIWQRIREGKLTQPNGEMTSFMDEFDVSGYSSDHPLFTGISSDKIVEQKSKNKKVPGLMKDELDGNVLLEFVGLRAKAYAMKQLIVFENDQKDWDDGEVLEIKKLKGIQKCVVQKNISFDNFLECLFNQREHYADTTSLRSFDHKIKTLAVRKLAMSPYDDKRFLLEDGITSIPFGHKYCGKGQYR